jgi:C4-type Zn-finger protein
MLRERLAEVTEFKDNVIEDLRQRLDAEAEERRKLTMILTDWSYP